MSNDSGLYMVRLNEIVNQGKKYPDWPTLSQINWRNTVDNPRCVRNAFYPVNLSEISGHRYTCIHCQNEIADANYDHVRRLCWMCAEYELPIFVEKKHKKKLSKQARKRAANRPDVDPYPRVLKHDVAAAIESNRTRRQRIWWDARRNA
jgi:hypothetical protein